MRPQTRADCVGGPRPCPFVSCRYHLFVDIKSNGAIHWNYGDDPEALLAMAHSCALDVATEGGTTRDFLGDVLNVNRERIRQIEVAALKKLLARLT